MSKIKDRDLQNFFDAVNTDSQGIKQPEPAFQRFRKYFLRDFDWDNIKKYSPQQIIQGARTQEELFIIGEHLEREWGRDHWWWKLYHYKRIQLGHLPSLYGVEDIGSPNMKGVWGTPVAPQEYLRYKNLSGPQATAVDRRMYPGFTSYEQLIGKKPIMSFVETPNGPELKQWKGFASNLKSNISNKALVFDIEATDLLGKNANIVSMGISGIQEESWFSPFDRSKKHSEFIEEVIYPQWKKASAGKTLISEEELVKNAISTFENAPKDTAIMGYNIKQYDIPLLYEKAKSYGLQSRFEKAILARKDNIVDVAEHAQSFVSSQIGGKYLGWQEGDIGLKPLGWKLETVAESLGYSSKGLAHEASEDVAMTKFVWGKLLPQNIEASKKTFQASVQSGKFEESVYKLTGRKLLKLKPGMEFVNFSGQMLPEEKYLRSFGSHMAEVFGKPKVSKVADDFVKPGFIGKLAETKALGKKTLGGVARYASIFTASNLLLPGGFVRNALGSVAFDVTRHMVKKSGGSTFKQFGLAISADLAFQAIWGLGSSLKSEPEVKFSEVFSGADDAYNTIEGFPEQGFAKQNRQELTDFGSGYQGLPDSLMGVPIDPRILEFRRQIIDDKEEKRDLEIRLKEAQREAQTEVGKLRREDTREADLSIIEGINQRNKAIREVNLDRFRVEVEDADTLILHRRGLQGLFSNPLQVRLSGMDAPEITGHSNDPMEEIRIWQDQPGGVEATERFRQLVEGQENVRLLVDVKNQTYGRSLGVVIGDENKNLALEAIRQGMTAALPFGDVAKDVVSRSQAQQAEQMARAQEAGIWRLSRYKAIHETNKAIGGPITYNMMTEINKLSSNLSFGAYGSFLESLGRREGDLTSQEMATARRLGRTLKKSFGPNRFSGRDDNYNTIEGLKHTGGIAEQIRKENTEFGSGWDPARAIAKKLYKRMPEKKAFKLLRESPEWETMLKEAKEVKELSYGSYGTTYLMEGKLHGEKFKFIKKTPDSVLSDQGAQFNPNVPTKERRIRALREEADIMPRLENRISPSPYGYDPEQNSLYMELMPGKTVHELLQEGEVLPTRRINKILKKESKKAAKAGIVNPDIHTGNIMYDPDTDKLSWIDWGLAKSSGRDKADITSGYEEMMAATKEKLITPMKSASSRPKSVAQDEFFDDWGDLNSVSESAEIPQTVPNTLGFGRTIPQENMISHKPVSPQKLSNSTVQHRKQAVRRNHRFNQASKESVGVGFRAAKNAGKKHSSFTSTRNG